MDAERKRGMAIIKRGEGEEEEGEKNKNSSSNNNTTTKVAFCSSIR